MDSNLNRPCADPQGTVAECAAIAADLDRLAALVAESGRELLLAFEQLAAPGTPAEARATAVAQAVGALQFEDIAQQLIAHARARLVRIEAVQLRETALLDHPVAQSSMTAGAVELF